MSDVGLHTYLLALGWLQGLLRQMLAVRRRVSKRIASLPPRHEINVRCHASVSYQILACQTHGVDTVTTICAAHAFHQGESSHIVHLAAHWGLFCLHALTPPASTPSPSPVSTPSDLPPGTPFHSPRNMLLHFHEDTPVSSSRSTSFHSFEDTPYQAPEETPVQSPQRPSRPNPSVRRASPPD